MPKRLFWMSSGYVAGAASSWWMQRKLKRTVERTVENMPNIVRKEVTDRFAQAGERARERVSVLPEIPALPGMDGARDFLKRVRPADDTADADEIIDLAGDQSQSLSQPPMLELVTDEQTTHSAAGDTAMERLRERARRART